MKKIILAFIVCIILPNFAYSSTNDILKAKSKVKYPESYEVEPRIDKSNNADNLIIKGGIEHCIDVNLEDCIRLALGNNPRIQSAMQDVFASNARVKQIWSNYFPQFSWQTGYSRIRQLQLSDVFDENLIYNYWVLGQISGSQLLYDFGVTQNQATIKNLDSLGYKIILTGTVNDVVYNVKDAYYNLQYAIEARCVAEDTVKQYTLFYDQAKAFYNAGIKPKVDVTISEVNLSNAKLMLIQTEHAVQIAMAKLNNAIGIPYYTKYNISEKLRFDACDIKLDKAIKITEKSRPEFQLADVKVKQANQNVKLIKKSWFPQLYMQGQFEVGGSHPTSNYGYSWGAYLNFPTVNGMLLKHEIREARSLYSREQANAKNTKNTVYLEVQNAFYTLDEKRNKIPVASVGLKQAKDNYELSFNRYKVGVGSPVELRDAQVQYENSKLTYYQTLYEYNSAIANLEKSMGRNICSNEVKLDNKSNNG